MAEMGSKSNGNWSSTTFRLFLTDKSSSPKVWDENGLASSQQLCYPIKIKYKLNCNDPGLVKTFLDMKPKEQTTIRKNKLCFINTQNFCASEDIIKKEKR